MSSRRNGICTPYLDIRFLGQTTEGIYREDPLDCIHPDTINRYYGVAGARRRRPRNQTGAGIASDDEGESNADGPSVEEEVENQMGADLAQNIRHEPSDFLELLEGLLEQPDAMPEDYGVLEDEWEEEDYPEIEIVKPGTRGEELVIALPRPDWFPRAARWAQALDLLTRFLDKIEGTESASGNEDGSQDLGSDDSE
ncbi:hypothetical protein B0H17DRAFT_1216458 [Mycena rosella]|uniref:Uncharacterized protein n=1 Tax=Mycena rosella TaxID=1033263 RepID=A0AAD7C742_MYCRO|nr:hypothetical protein B0H17DRAFT_1216458 [Mycena rosella]